MAAALEQHATRLGKPLSLAGRVDMEDVERLDSVTRVSQSSFEFHTDFTDRLDLRVSR